MRWTLEEGEQLNQRERSDTLVPALVKEYYIKTYADLSAPRNKMNYNGVRSETSGWVAILLILHLTYI